MTRTRAFPEADVERARAVDIVTIARVYVEAMGGELTRSGATWRGPCPLHGGTRDDSFAVYPESNLYKCFSCGKAGDVISLVQKMDRLDFRGAVERLAGSLPPAVERPRANGTSRAPMTFPTLDAAAEWLARKHGTETGRWTYRDTEGNIAFLVLRFDRQDGEGKRRKTYRPVHLAGDKWHLGDPPGKLPLYRLHEIAGAERPYIPEGEQCAEAVAALGLAATTNAHGAGSARRTDWSPLNGKRGAVLLLDNDAEGEEWAREATREIRALPKPPRVVLVRFPHAEKGYDVADFLDDHDALAPEELRALLETMADEAPEAPEEDAPAPEAEREDDAEPDRTAEPPRVRVVAPFAEGADPLASLARPYGGIRLALPGIGEHVEPLTSEVVLIGAHASIGKSTLLMQLADRANEDGTHVLILPAEQSRRTLEGISLARRGSVDSRLIERGEIPERVAAPLRALQAEWLPVVQRLRRYAVPWPQTPEGVALAVDDFMAGVPEGERALVMLDGLHNMRAGKHESRRTEIDYIMGALRSGTCERHGIPLVATSQLSRNGLFKESGGLDYLADTILRIERPQAERGEEAEETEQKRLRGLHAAGDVDATGAHYRHDYLTLILQKQRDGARGCRALCRLRTAVRTIEAVHEAARWDDGF